MTTDNEQTTGMGVAQRFVKAAEELHLSGGRLYRDGIVANEQVLSKIKNGWQKPQKKSIELLCKKYNINAAWLYTGEGDMFLAGIKPFEQHVRSENERLFYNTDFELCLSNDGQPITTGCVIPISLPMAGDFDFMCINNDKSLAPIIMPGDVIALKKLATWKTYIPGDFICVVVTNEYKVLRKVSVTQPDEQSINFRRVQHSQGHHRGNLQGRRQLPPPVNRPDQTRHPPTQLTKS